MSRRDKIPKAIQEVFDLDDKSTLPISVHNRARSRDQLNTFRMKTSLEDIQSMAFWKSLLGEFVGTFLLVMMGVGSCVQSWQPDHLDVVQIALSFGLSVATSVWIVGHISGGHINPAVTAAMFITRRISLVKAILYMIMQCVASIAASLILKAVTPASKRGPLGCTTLGEEVTSGQGFVIEMFLTMLLVLTVFASCDKNRKDLGGSFPLTIGLSVTVGHLWAVEFTGSSMNPARSLGPAVVMDIWTDHWTYWIGPLNGGVLAGLLYHTLLAPNASLLKVRNCLLASDFDDERYKIYWIGPLTGGLLAGLLYDTLLAPNASLLKVRNCLLASDFDDERYKARRKKVVVLEEEEEDSGKDSEETGDRTHLTDSV